MKRVIPIFSVLLLMTVNCSASKPEHEYKLNDAYENIYLSHFGLEYPPNEQYLKTCQQKNDEVCLKPYKLVQQAKDYLLNAITENKEQTFQRIINTITVYCPKTKNRNNTTDEYYCYGAVIALYLFNDPIYDSKILDFVHNAPKPVINALFATQYEWFYNRPNVDEWISLVTKLPKEILDEDEKRAPLYHFNEAKSHTFEKFGLML